jgi:hypothetical protein
MEAKYRRKQQLLELMETGRRSEFRDSRWVTGRTTDSERSQEIMMAQTLNF